MKTKKLQLILGILTATYLLPITTASAHVGYVLDEHQFATNAGSDFNYLLTPLKQPFNLVLMIVTIIAIALTYYLSTHIKLLLKEINFIKKEAQSYSDLIPWMLRLSLGIALIGAGTSGVFISPILSGSPTISFFQILLGFLFMIGLFLAPITFAVIPLFIIAFMIDPYLFGNLDLFVAAIALLILAEPKPGIDDLTGIPFLSPLTKLKPYVPFILRIGIGSAMTFLGVFEKLLNPHTSELVAINYNLINAIPVSAAMWVLSAGLIETAVGILIILGLRTRVTSAIAVAVLSLSFFYFNEEVYSHITLFGVLSVLFVTGGGKWSLDSLIQKRFPKSRN